MKVAVLGSGSGAPAAAADMSRHGRAVTRADLDDDVPAALDGAELIIVATPAPAHDLYVNAIAPHVTAHQTVLFLGEGSGAIVARRVIDPPTVIAAANTAPLPAGLTGPGSVAAGHLGGGVLISALPATPSDTARVMGLIDDVWPGATATDTVWNTVLANYNAIGQVAAMVTNANAGTDATQDRTGGGWLRAEDATPAMVNVIEAVDAELLALRQALNSKEPRRYRDFLVAQGLAPDLGPDTTLFDTVRASEMAVPDAPAEDGPYALVLASSLGRATGVPTSGIDGLVDIASAMLGRDFRAEGRTLATLGLDGLDTTGLIGFARTGVFP